MEAVATVAILGSGPGGAAWALLCALARCSVRVHDPSHDALERSATLVREGVDLATGQGALTRGERQRVLDGVLFTSDLDEATTAADLFVDADEAPAGNPWPAVYEALRASALVAAAGGRTPEEIAARLPHPARVLSFRLLRTPGPLHRVEVSAARQTSPHALARARQLVERINRAAGFPERR